MHPFRMTAAMACLILLSTGLTHPATAEGAASPGSAGIGDPYFPLDGNGGYDVERYDLQIRYDPATQEIIGRAQITATATQDLSSFNLDLDGLTVDSVSVAGRAAAFTRAGGELTITPAAAVREKQRFVTVVRYHGVPMAPTFFGAGVVGGVFRHDQDALAAGEPYVASTWFPANDHPRDAALVSLEITAPADLQAVGIGKLVDQSTSDGWTTWRWQTDQPVATYLVAWVVGEYVLDSHVENGIQFLDAVSAGYFSPVFTPTTGDFEAISGKATMAYKRITRELTIPASGATLSFQVSRHTEPDYDFFFVEAHHPGADDWTTLPDLGGHTSRSPGGCISLFYHPFLFHYQSFNCASTGMTGQWWAASGLSDGWEQWTVDLSAYAGQTVEISLAYETDDIGTPDGVAIDDIEVSTGEGSTSFEDGDTAGWQVPGAPPEDTVNENDFFVATAADGPEPVGTKLQPLLARQSETLAFEASLFGPYPYRDAGAIIHPFITHFALENQSRPTYPGFLFEDDGYANDGSVFVHELAHQWFGDQVRLDSWKHVWLNEGFATYAEWLWSEAHGEGTTDDYFNAYHAIPATNSFWRVKIGDPGPARLFAFQVYVRGAMTLHQLRRTVGDDVFFRILRAWAATPHTGTTEAFIALAEQESGIDLHPLFNAWLFTTTKPPLFAAAAPLAADPDTAARSARQAERSQGAKR